MSEAFEFLAERSPIDPVCSDLDLALLFEEEFDGFKVVAQGSGKEGARGLQFTRIRRETVRHVERGFPGCGTRSARNRMRWGVGLERF